jgi:hypothetical protein
MSNELNLSQFVKTTKVRNLKEGDRILVDADGMTITRTVNSNLDMGRGLRSVRLKRIEGMHSIMMVPGKTEVMVCLDGWECEEQPDGTMLWRSVS